MSSGRPGSVRFLVRSILGDAGRAAHRPPIYQRMEEASSFALDPPAHWRLACFLAGLASLWLAIASPLDALRNFLLTAHMIQHLLLIMVAASA